MLNHLLHRFSRRPALPAPPAADDTPPEGRPLGCGWFDSSHELSCGLNVTEHASADAVAADLPLADWLSLHLAGRCLDGDGQRA